MPCGLFPCELAFRLSAGIASDGSLYAEVISGGTGGADSGASAAGAGGATFESGGIALVL